MGRPIVAREQIESGIEIESRRYGDILLADFDDTYRNLSLKSLAILRWSQLYCTSAEFIFQGDSDALVFPQQVQTFVRQITNQHTPRIYGGFCWPNARVVRNDGKWFDHPRKLFDYIFSFYIGNSIRISMHRRIFHRIVRAPH